MPIITAQQLASYLEVDATPALNLKAELAGSMVAELLYKTGIPATVPARVRAIALEAAARAVRNPNGYASETIDDYTYRRDSETRAAGVYLTDAERAELLNAISIRPRGGLVSMPLVSPLDVE